MGPKALLILIKLVSPVAFARAFNLATPINLLTHYAKGTPSFFYLKLRLLIGLLIQVYFTMLIQYFSNFPLQYFSLLLNL